MLENEKEKINILSSFRHFSVIKLKRVNDIEIGPLICHLENTRTHIDIVVFFLLSITLERKI